MPELAIGDGAFSIFPPCRECAILSSDVPTSPQDLSFMINSRIVKEALVEKDVRAATRPSSLQMTEGSANERP